MVPVYGKSGTALVILIVGLAAFSFIPGLASAQGSSGDLKRVPLYFEKENSGIERLMSPVAPAGQESSVPGIDTNFIPGTMGFMPLGTWTTRNLNTAIIINGELTLDLWLSSGNGARNIKFNVFIEKDDEQVLAFNFTKDTLPSDPTKVRATESLTLDIDAGQTLKVRLQFDAPPIGGSLFSPAQVELHYAGKDVPSGIIILTDPFQIDIPKPDMTPDDVTFRVRIVEAFDIDTKTNLNYTMTVTGPTPPRTITADEVEKLSDTGHPTVISRAWVHTKDDPKDGVYDVSISVSYDGENLFSDQNSSDLKFPTPPPGNIDVSNLPRSTIVIGAVIGVAIFGVLAYIYIVRPRHLAKKARMKRKAGRKARREREEDEYEDVEEVEEVEEEPVVRSGKKRPRRGRSRP